MEHVTDHDARALGRRIEQYKPLARLAALISTVTPQVQAVEDALWQLATERTLDLATGATLDVIGKLLGLARDGLGDTDYRQALRAEIRVNLSNGTIEDVLTVMRLVATDGTTFTLTDWAIANFTLELGENVFTLAEAARLLVFLRKTRAAGIGGELVTRGYAPASTFCFANGPGLGFGAGHFRRSFR